MSEGEEIVTFKKKTRKNIRQTRTVVEEDPAEEEQGLM